MTRYRCVAVDGSGKERELVREAPSSDEAARSFSTGDLFLLSIEPLENRAEASRSLGVSRDAVREFTDMTALLLESGMGLREALEVEAEIGGKRLKPLATEFLSEIDRGDSFSQVLERRSASFSPLYRGMVRIGERVGSLRTVIPRLSSYLADRKAFRDKLSGALAYPLLVLALALAGSAVVAFFLLPKLQGLFQELGGTGAGEIQARVAFASRLFRSLATIFAAAVAAVLVILRVRKREGTAKEAVDRVLLSLPLVGRFAKDWETLNFAFAMEILAEGGVPLEEALAEAARTAGNAAFRAAVLSAREDLVKGAPLSTALGSRREIPAYVSRWIGAGERSGQTARVFAQVRSFFQAEIDRGASRAAALLEPVLIVLVGGIVLFLVMSFVVPLFSLYGSFI